MNTTDLLKLLRVRRPQSAVSDLRIPATSRLIRFAGFCAFVAVTVYPTLVISYTSWSDQENQWVFVEAYLTRAFWPEVEYWGEANIDSYEDPHLHALSKQRRFYVPDHRLVKRTVALYWPSMRVQWALVVLFFLGLEWALRPADRVRNTNA